MAFDQARKERRSREPGMPYRGIALRNREIGQRTGGDDPVTLDDGSPALM